MGGGDSKIDETDQQRVLAEVSMNKWRDYLALNRPFEDSYIDDVDRMNTGSMFDQVASISATPVESMFSNAVDNTATGMVAAGINPNSGLFKQELEKLDRNKRKSKVDAMSQAQLGQQNRYLGGLQNVVNMGQGQSTNATQGIMDISSMSQNKARNDANLAMQSRYANQQIVGAGAGAATRYGLQNIDNKQGGE